MLFIGVQTLLIFFLTFILTISVVQWWRGRTSFKQKYPGCKLPPGPRGFPLVGSIFSLGRNPHLTFMEMAKKYGNVFTVNLAGQNVLVLNGFEAVREALVKQSTVFAGRPHLALTQELTEGQGIVSADYGSIWREQRRFTLQTLRNFGFGKQSFETNIQEEIRCMLDEFRATSGKPFNANHVMETSVSNVVCSINFGQRFQYDDPSFEKLVQSIYRFSEIGTNASAVNYFPILRRLPFPDLKEVYEIEKTMKSFMYGMIESHKKTKKPGINRDLIDGYLHEIDRRKGEGLEDEASKSFNEVYLYHTLSDLLFAGTETMSSTLRWAVLYMIKYPHIQAKVQEELDSVVERDQLPSWRQRSQLPYTEATLMEVQRVANITAIGFPHKTTEDTQLFNYFIPKDTSVFINLYSVHVDSSEWENPDEFNPNRFLTKEGKVYNHPALMPFSAGKRSCPGENLAKMQLFLFFSSILQKFRLTTTPSNPDPSLEKHYAISLCPSPFEVCAYER